MHENDFSIEFIPDKKGKNDMVPFEFERHMMQVAGDAADIIPNSIKDFDLRDLKELFKRYLDILLRTYKVNIQPLSTSLMKQIEVTIELAQAKIKNVKAVDELCLFMIAAIGDLNFLVLGGRLDNTPKDNRRSKNRLKLDQYSTIHYVQTPCQKANLICDYIQMTRPDECLERIKNKRLEMKSAKYVSR